MLTLCSEFLTLSLSEDTWMSLEQLRIESHIFFTFKVQVDQNEAN